MWEYLAGNLGSSLRVKFFLNILLPQNFLRENFSPALITPLIVKFRLDHSLLTENVPQKIFRTLVNFSVDSVVFSEFSIVFIIIS